MNKHDSTSDPASRCRPFGLLHGMFLIAAFALWLVGLRGWLAVKSGWPADLPKLSSDGPILLSHEIYGSVAGILVAVDEGALYFLTVVLLSGFYLWTRVCRPRPLWKRLLVQPGMLICLMVLAAYLIASCFASSAAEAPPTSPYINLANRSYILAPTLGSVWGLACFAMRSTIEPGWIEWLGRFVGLGWVGIGLVNFVMLSLR